MNALKVWALGLMFCMAAASAARPATALYDPNPKHLWNRLNEALFVRTAPDTGERYGSEELDILFWTTTKHLLTSPSHERALQVLDEFIRTHGERLIRDPMTRALLQRDLWQLFDWSAVDDHSPARAELQQRLATVIKRVALSEEEIAKLPDNYAEADARLDAAGFPHGLFAADGPWLAVANPYGDTAPEHTHSFGNRSVFTVFVNFPEGREQAQRYLKQLREFTPAMIYTTEAFPARSAASLAPNPATPQFPANTIWALVRRMFLIDDQGHIRPTRLVESIQTRKYVSIPDVNHFFSSTELRPQQVVAEFQMDHQHPPALRAVVEGERDFQFVHFRGMGADLFELSSAADWARDRELIRAETLRTCFGCHAAPGILSINSYTGFGMAVKPLEGATPDRETGMAIYGKANRYDWGLLQGLWRH